jgi:hypothetical protein
MHTTIIVALFGCDTLDVWKETSNPKVMTMTKSTKCANPSNLDMFDINGENKLAAESVYAREAIIKRYAEDDNMDSIFFVSDSSGKD